MNRSEKTRRAVTHRSKGNTGPRRKARKLASEPEMKELTRMIDAGEVDLERTVDYLEKGTKR